MNNISLNVHGIKNLLKWKTSGKREQVKNNNNWLKN